MIRKSAFSALALAFSSPALLSNAPPTIHIHYPLVKQVKCFGSRGTAFRIGPTQMLSVAHVTDAFGCTIEGQPFTAVTDEGLDFVVIEVPASLRRSGALRINCGGFIPGQYYWASGYARGMPWQQQVVVRAWPDKAGGQQVLYGYPTFIPGMSGGPVMNAAGEVVGLVNRYHPFAPFSLSLALKDTSICKGR
jgi:hypothetical protein